MSSFANFSFNLEYLLKNFKPGKTLSNLGVCTWTRSKDKATGCRSTGPYLFLSLINNVNDLNKLVHIPNNLRDFLSNVNNAEDCFDMVSINTVTMFTILYNWGGYYTPLHTFCILNIENNYRIIQSWDDGRLSIDVNSLSGKWTNQNLMIDLVNLFKTYSSVNWNNLFTNKTLKNVSDDNETIKYKFKCKFITAPIHDSWVTEKIIREKKEESKY